MVQMGMRQDDCIDLGRCDRKLLPIQFAELAMTLKKAAVYKDPRSFMFDQVLGSGNGSGPAKAR